MNDEPVPVAAPQLLVLLRDVGPERVLGAVERLTDGTPVPGSVVEMNVFDVNEEVAALIKHFAAEHAHETTLNFHAVTQQFLLC